ncbi:MAG: type 4a pilus biogenesis protein PilO [Patescibacteria group bacterium]|jgi:Tfp pilus assembly protein PilO|nr:type 4a pilus biogenesis protein PilO [Patescibacteria group bacterium]
MNSSAKKVHSLLIAFLILSGLLALGLFIAGWYYVYGVSSNMSKIRTESIYLNKQADQLSNLEIKYRKIAVNENMIYESIPKDKAVSSFIADVELVAQKNALKTIESVVGNQKAGGKVVNPDLSQLITKGDYYELPIKFTFSGSYNNFTALVSDITKLRRISSISGLDIKKDNANTNGLTDNVIASINLSIYIKK